MLSIPSIFVVKTTLTFSIYHHLARTPYCQSSHSRSLNYMHYICIYYFINCLHWDHWSVEPTAVFAKLSITI